MSFVNDTKDGRGTLVQSCEEFNDLLSVVLGLGIFGRHQVVCYVTKFVGVFLQALQTVVDAYLRGK